MDSKVKGGLSVSHTNLLNIVQGYKLRGQQRESECTNFIFKDQDEFGPVFG